jgi:C-terminal processing protease CtpA/Prc
MTSNFLNTGDTIIRFHQREVLPDRNEGITVDTAYLSDASHANARFPKPTILMVDSGSASAAEIFTAAILDKRTDIKVMGCNTYGKARGQYFLPTPGGGLARITYAKLMTSKGYDYNEVGLAPTIPLATGTDWLDAAYRQARSDLGLPMLKTHIAGAHSRTRDIELNRKLLGLRKEERLTVLHY